LSKVLKQPAGEGAIALLVNADRETKSWVVCLEPSLQQAAISLEGEQTKLSDDA
jgi:hypothetical protein